jgi:hypothetical protein
MATQQTRYLASDGKTFSDLEIAREYQEGLDDTNGKQLSIDAFDIFLNNAKGNSKYWGWMNMQRTSTNRRITQRSTDGVDMIRDIFLKDLKLVVELATIIGAHKFDIPYSIDWFNASTGEKEDSDKKLVEG